MDRIGGEFEILIADYFSLPRGIEQPTYKKKYSIALDTGRSALLIALINIVQKGGKKEAWLPRYHCESVLLPFKQAGFTVHFYSLGEDLRTPATLPSHIDGATILVIHYFGKKNEAMTKWVKGQKGDPFYIIEDCVQATLNTNVGEIGDYVMNSYRKFLPQPDGAILASDDLIECSLQEPDEIFISQKITAKILRGCNDPSELFLPLFAEAERRIEHIIRPRVMSWMSTFLLKRTDMQDIARKRVSNWRYLVTALKTEGLTGSHITLLSDTLDTGEVPLGLPIRVEQRQRDELLAFLKSHSIYCPVHWHLHEDHECVLWEPEHRLSKSILTLPIDQRLTQTDLERMVDTIKRYFIG